MMNKQKKRRISKGKFERVLFVGVKIGFNRPLLGLEYYPAVSYNGFLYWLEFSNKSYELYYYRKSISEALK